MECFTSDTFHTVKKKNLFGLNVYWWVKLFLQLLYKLKYIINFFE